MNILEGLQSGVKWAGYRWKEECEENGYRFQIREVYRSQERQNELYKIGRRGIPGEKPVTWTLLSWHTMGLAMDVYPENCTHANLAAIAAKYGITHPFPSLDPPHYEFVHVGPENPVVSLSVEAKIKALGRAIARASGSTKLGLQNQLDRLMKRLRRV